MASIIFARYQVLVTSVCQAWRRETTHVFFKAGVDEILNLQPKQSQAKPYQVKQVRDLIVKYGLLGNEDEE